MTELVPASVAHALFAGTWINLAVIAEVLIAARLVDRDELAGLMAHAEGSATDERRLAYRALRRLLQENRPVPSEPPRCGAGACRMSEGLGPRTRPSGPAEQAATSNLWGGCSLNECGGDGAGCQSRSHQDDRHSGVNGPAVETKS